MNTLLLRTLILLSVAVAAAVAHSWNTTVVLNLEPQDEVDWEEVDRQLAAKTAEPGQPAEEQTAGAPEKPAETPEPPPKRVGADAAPGDPYITVERARQLYDLQYLGHRQVIFLDARARAQYESGHIAGAISLPAGDFGAMIPAKATTWLPGTAIVIYCQGEECSDSHDVARRLQGANLDISPILILKAGYPAWAEAGHPISAGPDVGWDL
jgi:rhodanese-related sulfurtransferase